MEINKMLEEEYTRTLQALAEAKNGTDEAKWALTKLTELHKQIIDNRTTEHKCWLEARRFTLDERDAERKGRIELQKVTIEEGEAARRGCTEAQKIALDERETALKEQQAKEGKALSVAKIVVDGVAIVLPIAASWIWMGRGLRFEQTGTFTSRSGNWLSNHLRLFRK